MAVLVIDDEPSIADALELILSDSGYDVETARTGRAGLERVKRRRFDVTITDLTLPDISGLDVVSFVRETNPDALIIVITAHSTPEIVCESIKRGALDVLPKPFFPSDVLTLMSNALTEKAPAN
ncbi:MAG TPA: response regulator [Blastocatellia bacterium]|jgi:DNA-binding NtrC family response regulator